MPFPRERAEHELTHLSSRSWCRACVEGRLDIKPHAKLSRHHDVSTVLMDYGFVSKTGDEKSLTILIPKDRGSRILMGDVALHNGRGKEETVQQAAGDVERLGRAKIIVKIDNEAALLA